MICPSLTVIFPPGSFFARLSVTLRLRCASSSPCFSARSSSRVVFVLSRRPNCFPFGRDYSRHFWLIRGELVPFSLMSILLPRRQCEVSLRLRSPAEGGTRSVVLVVSKSTTRSWLNGSFFFRPSPPFWFWISSLLLLSAIPPALFLLLACASNTPRSMSLACLRYPRARTVFPLPHSPAF